MFYRPKFCCGCGEKVERVDWKPWTSRRFCQLCETRHPLAELAQKVWPWLGTFGLIIGIASYWPSSQAPVSPVAKRALTINSNVQSSQVLPTFKTTVPPIDQSQPSSRVDRPNANEVAPAVEKPQAQTAQKTEAVYYCGAETKKGTPCTRKVKGNVRCWQHQGMPAMMPASKLLVSK